MGRPECHSARRDVRQQCVSEQTGSCDKQHILLPIVPNPIPNDTALVRRMVKQAPEDLTAETPVSSIEAINTGFGACLRMPDDVLYEVFSTYLLKDTPFPPTPSQLFDPAYNTITPGASIWILAQVCSRWRAILLSSPLLWSSIRFSSAHCCLDRFCRAGIPTRLLDLQLKRSGNALLEISWSASSPCSVPLLRMLLVHSARWGRVSMGRIPPEGVDCPQGLQYHLSHLQSLRISTQFLARLPSLKDAPNLTTLRLEANTLSTGDQKVFSKLPLRHLKHLFVEKPYSSSFLSILSQTPSIETVEVNGSGVLRLAVGPNDLAPLDLPELRRLRMQGLGFQPIFGCIISPLLTTVHVSIGNSPSSIYPLLSHCADRISSLALDDVRGVDEEGLRRLLRKCHHLMELSVGFSGPVQQQSSDIDALLRSLICTDDESLCPSLQSLSLLVEIHSLHTPAFDGQLLAQMQLSRKRNTIRQPLKRVRLSLQVVAGIFNTTCQVRSYANELMSRGFAEANASCSSDECVCDSQLVVGGEVKRSGPRHLGTDYIEIPFSALDRGCSLRLELHDRALHTSWLL